MSEWNGEYLFLRSPTTLKLRIWSCWAEDDEIIVETGNVGGSLNLKVTKVKRADGKLTKEQTAIKRAKALEATKRKEGWGPNTR